MSGQKKDKKALTVNLELTVRVIIDEDIDPNMDEEFDQAILLAVKNRIKEEGKSFLAEGISDFQNDTENPYNEEYDDN